MWITFIQFKKTRLANNLSKVCDAVFFLSKNKIINLYKAYFFPIIHLKCGEIRVVHRYFLENVDKLLRGCWG